MLKEISCEVLEDVVLRSLEDFVDEVDGDSYIYNMYIDYHYSGLSDMSIADILENYQSLYEIEGLFIDSFYQHGEYDQLIESILSKTIDKLGQVNRDEVIDIVSEHLVVNPILENSLMYVDVNLNLLADFGDANYDFTLNEYDTIFSEEAYEKSSILNLVELLGYSKDKFLRYLKNENNNFNEEMEEEEMELFEDLYHEILNTTTSMNALTFFVKTNLRDYLIFQEEKLESITIKKDSVAGLYDGWNGAGSILEINIPRDITIKKENLIVEVDQYSNLHSVEGIYGIHDLWDEAEFNL